MALTVIPSAFFERLTKNAESKTVPGVVVYFTGDGSCYINAEATCAENLTERLQEFWNLTNIDADDFGFSLLDLIEEMTDQEFADFVLEQWDRKHRRRDLVRLAHQVDNWLSTVPQDWPGALPGYDREWLRNLFSVVYAAAERKDDKNHALIRAIEAVFEYGYQQGSKA